MLSSLHIENIALIDKLNIDFSDNLNVMSGETGAGKSIIVDSLSFVLGERADKTLIKHGKDKAFVEAVFEIEQSDRCFATLQELGFEGDTTVVISRTLTFSGKNESRVNGRIVPATVLREITGTLVDVFGQSQHQNLYRTDSHIIVLDNYNYAQNLFDQLSELNSQYKENKKKMSVFGGDESQRARAIDILKYQIDEIKNAKPDEKEEAELLATKNRMANAEKLAQSLSLALNTLSENSDIPKSLSKAVLSLTSASGLDGEIASLSERLSQARLEIEDIIDACEKLATELEYNPSEMDKIVERLETIKQLKRKYGGSVQSVKEFLLQAEKDYDRLINATEEIEKLTSEREKILDKMYSVSQKLSAHRKNIAENLEKDIKNQLSDLGMNGACFVVSFTDEPSRENYIPSSKGYDKVEFLFSANKGEPVKPLAKILSGGEMSRFMLAIKNITAQIEAIPTMVFDEIDIGISGVIAQMLAKKLSNISRSYQCIVITHLPQVAAMGERNLLITKIQDDTSTKTNLSILSEKEKIQEVARLSGGENIGEYSLLHAQELIKWANDYKSKRQ